MNTVPRHVKNNQGSPREAYFSGSMLPGVIPGYFSLVAEQYPFLTIICKLQTLWLALRTLSQGACDICRHISDEIVTIFCELPTILKIDDETGYHRRKTAQYTAILAGHDQRHSQARRTTASMLEKFFWKWPNFHWRTCWKRPVVFQLRFYNCRKMTDTPTSPAGHFSMIILSHLRKTSDEPDENIRRSMERT